MAVKQGPTSPSLSLSPNLKCSTCNMNLGEKTEQHAPWYLRPGQTVNHCDGSPCAFGAKQLGPHHTLTPWPTCWKCRQPLGCPKCVSCTRDEVFCEACLAWGTRDAFLAHGPVSNDPNQLRKRLGRMAPQADAYPQAWISRLMSSEAQFYEALGHISGEHINARRMLDVFSAAVPERYADTILRQWRERQAS